MCLLAHHDMIAQPRMRSTIKKRIKLLWDSFSFHLLICALIQQQISILWLYQLYILWFHVDEYAKQYHIRQQIMPYMVGMLFGYEHVYFAYCFVIHWIHAEQLASMLVLEKLQYGTVQILTSVFVVIVLTLFTDFWWAKGHRDMLNDMNACSTPMDCEVGYDYVTILRLTNTSFYTGDGDLCEITWYMNMTSRNMTAEDSRRSVDCLHSKYRIDRLSCLGNVAVNHGLLAVFLIVYLIIIRIDKNVIMATRFKVSTELFRFALHPLNSTDRAEQREGSRYNILMRIRQRLRQKTAAFNDYHPPVDFEQSTRNIQRTVYRLARAISKGCRYLVSRGYRWYQSHRNYPEISTIEEVILKSNSLSEQEQSIENVNFIFGESQWSMHTPKAPNSRFVSDESHSLSATTFKPWAWRKHTLEYNLSRATTHGDD